MISMCNSLPTVDHHGILMPHSLPPEILDQIAERFRVLAEPARLRILNVLLAGERTVSELVEETGLNQANVSKHLGLLRNSSFVDRRKEGLYAYYSVSDPSVGVLCEIMCGRLEEQAAEQAALLGTGS
jgi:ArsR family transcriptional regulator